MNDDRTMTIAFGGHSLADFQRRLATLPAISEKEARAMVAGLQRELAAAEREAHGALLVDTPIPALERELPLPLGGKTDDALRYVLEHARRLAPSATRRTGLNGYHPTGLNRKTRRRLERELASARKRVQRLESTLGYRP